MLFASTILIVLIACILPFTVIGSLFGFVQLAGSFYAVLAALVIGYLVIVEAVKYWFFRKFGGFTERSWSRTTDLPEPVSGQTLSLPATMFPRAAHRRVITKRGARGAPDCGHMTRAHGWSPGHRVPAVVQADWETLARDRISFWVSAGVPVVLTM